MTYFPSPLCSHNSAYIDDDFHSKKGETNAPIRYAFFVSDSTKNYE
jgi:hypothetical protein